jgi:murein DD-endopeptidase MepM/ murein hydrolase activator NlpD
MRRELLTLFKGFPSNSIVAIGCAGLLLAGCSSSIDRFADYPGRSDGTHTASVPSRGGAAASDDYIESSTLNGAPRASAGSNPYKAPVYAKAKTYNQNSSYEQAPYDPPEAPMPEERGGGTIVVEPGQTLYSIARANGMTAATLASANDIAPPYNVHAGQRIRIPGVDEPRAEAAYAPVSQNFSPKTSVHRVESGETLFSLGRSYGVHPYKIADLNSLSHNASLTVGQKIRIPGGKTAERIASEDIKVPAEEPSERYAEENTDQKQNFESDSDIAYAPPEDESSEPAGGEEQSEEQPAEETINSFRWPVKGRVISKFGSKPGGARNEGINIAVPEGTSVRAADGGVVAYAGNELKGYGNLVLIRHDGGWVTAYAHTRQLLVKRGDTVRRGDVIAKAGQTGSVESPQLHFELRKGATAVDPLKYLTAAQASN